MARVGDGREVEVLILVRKEEEKVGRRRRRMY